MRHKQIKRFLDAFERVRVPVTPKTIGEEKYEQIQKAATVLKMLAIANYGLAILAAIGFTTSPEYFNSKTYTVIWLREHFPDYCENIILTIHLTNFPVALVLCSLPVFMSYCAFNSDLQIIFINQAVRSICDTNIPPDERYTSALFQRTVRTKLKIGVSLHSHLIE